MGGGGGGGGLKQFPPFKRGMQKVPCIDGGGGGAQKSFGSAIFPFCSPLPPVKGLKSMTMFTGIIDTIFNIPSTVYILKWKDEISIQNK